MTGRRLCLPLGIAGHPAHSPALDIVAAGRVGHRRPRPPRLRRARRVPAARRLPRLAHRRLGCRRRHRRAAVPRRRRLRRRDARRRPRRVPARGGHRPRPARPVRHLRRGQPGPRPVRRADGRADGAPLRQGRARAVRRALRPPRPDEGPVARYLSDVAAASLLWPLGDRGQARRLHRVACPALVLWGDQDELLPVGDSAAVGRGRRHAGGDRRRRRPSARMGRARRGRRPSRRIPRDLDHDRSQRGLS